MIFMHGCFWFAFTIYNSIAIQNSIQRDNIANIRFLQVNIKCITYIYDSLNIHSCAQGKSAIKNDYYALYT